MTPRIPAAAILCLAALAAAPPDDLERARQANLDFASHMPNFVADETAVRYTSNTGPGNWRRFDIVATEIVIRGAKAVRQQVRRNGKLWPQSFETLPGFKWYGGFGTEIRSVFDPGCPTTIAFQGRAGLRGKPALEYHFESPAGGCFAFFYFGSQQANPARSGRVLVDEASGRVLQLEETAADFPPGFAFSRREEMVSWDTVSIGAESHLLPVAARFRVQASSGTWWRIEVTFQNHRHFEAASRVVY
jgi:hypothetical protein